MIAKLRALAHRHPWHPASVHLPLGLLLATPLWDGLAAVRPDEPWAFVARAGLIVGLIVSVPTATLGVVDLAALPTPSRARDVALVHACVMACALTAFGASLALRFGSLASSAWIADVIGSILLVGGGAVGGDLVYRLGVGQRPPAEEDR